MVFTKELRRAIEHDLRDRVAEQDPSLPATERLARAAATMIYEARLLAWPTKE